MIKKDEAKGGDYDDDVGGSSRFDRLKHLIHREENKVRPSKVKSSRYDDDNSSVVESIVSGDSHRSTLRIDRDSYVSKYARKDNRDENSTIGGNRDQDQMTERSDEFTIPRYSEGERLSHRDVRASSRLMDEVMNVKVNTAGQNNQLLSGTRYHSGQGYELQPSTVGMEGAHVASKTVISLRGNEHFIRELSRGTKSKLNRHGIQDAMIDTPYAHLTNVMKSSKYSMKDRIPFGSKQPVDIEMEAYDELSIHEINIQFVGFRPKI
jgi:hypothetical protein